MSEKLLTELADIGTYAPTTNKKIWELILAEGGKNAIGGIKKLPETIVKDEKVQAQVAGVIFGKWAMPNGNPFNVWTLVSVILTQAATKSVTKYGDAYLNAMDARYKPLIEELKQLDPMRPETIQKPAGTLVKLLKENGVNVSIEEAKMILTEITRNRDRAFKNMSNIVAAIDEFRKVAGK